MKIELDIPEELIRVIKLHIRQVNPSGKILFKDITEEMITDEIKMGIVSHLELWMETTKGQELVLSKFSKDEKWEDEWK